MVGEQIEKCNNFVMILLEDKVTGENLFHCNIVKHKYHMRYNLSPPILKFF